MFKLHDLGVEAFTFRFGHRGQLAAGLQHLVHVTPLRIGLLQVLRRLGRGLKLRIFLGQLDENVSGGPEESSCSTLANRWMIRSSFSVWIALMAGLVAEATPFRQDL